MIQITIESHFEHYSRFNVIAMCGGFDSENNQLYVTSMQKADGESLSQMQTDAAHHIELILYFIPKALPTGKNIAISDHLPFSAMVKVTSDSSKKTIYEREHQINAWGGAAIKLNLDNL